MLLLLFILLLLYISIRLYPFLRAQLFPFIPHPSYLISVSLSTSFALLFVLASSLNILLHLLGITLTSSLSTSLFSFTFILSLLFLLWHHLPALSFHLPLPKVPPGSRRIYTLALFVAASLLFLVYSYRLFLPIGHQDQLSQYLFDSYQVASLDRLSLFEYYQLGQFFRTDSLATFFDALILQISDSTLYTTVLRLLSILLSISLLSTLFYHFSRKLLYALVLFILFLTVPDLWDIGLSG